MDYSSFNDSNFGSPFYQEPENFINQPISNNQEPPHQLQQESHNEQNNEPGLSNEDEQKIKDILNAAVKNNSEMNRNSNPPNISQPPMRMNHHGPLFNHNNNKPQPQPEPEPEPEDQGKKPSVKLIFLALTIFISFMIALSVNEGIKYYINRSIKIYDGKPAYYIYYALATVAVGVLIFHLSGKYI